MGRVARREPHDDCGAHPRPWANERPDTLIPPQTPDRGPLSQGIYTLAQLRAYLAISGRRSDGENALHWFDTALNPIAHTPQQQNYSFSDLVSLFVVRELVRDGVPLDRIREVEDDMRAVVHADRPFVSEDVAAEGRPVHLKHVRYTDGTATAWSPAKGIVLDPRLQFGEPVLEGTTVPTATIADAVEVVGRDTAARRLGIEPSAAKAAVSFERRISATLS
jgi:hypothetical protein